VVLYSSLFVILSVRFIFIIRLKHLFTNICNLLVIWLVVFQVSQAYNNTDFTFVLNIHILTLFDILWFLHTGYSWTNGRAILKRIFKNWDGEAWAVFTRVGTLIVATIYLQLIQN